MEMTDECKQEILALVAKTESWCAEQRYAHPEDIRRKGMQLRATGRKMFESQQQ